MQHYFTFCHFAPDQVAGQKRGVSRIHQLSSFVSLASSLYLLPFRTRSSCRTKKGRISHSPAQQFCIASLEPCLYACVEMVAQSQSGTVMVFIAPQTSSSKCERCCYVSLRKRARLHYGGPAVLASHFPLLARGPTRAVSAYEIRCFASDFQCCH